MKNVIGLITANYKVDAMASLASERGIASVPFGGRYRLIDFSLSNMVNSGINVVGLITPTKYRSIIDHTGTGMNWNLDRKRGGLFILPGTSYGMATKGAHFMLRDLIQNRTYFNRAASDYILITSSDGISNIDYNPLIDAHIAYGSDITIACKTSTARHPGAIRIDEKLGKVERLSAGADKGDITFIDTFVINKDVLLRYLDWYESEDYLDLFYDIIGKDLNRVNVRTWHYEGYYRRVNSVNDYFDANMDLLNVAVGKELFKENAPIRTKVQDSVPAKIYGNAKVKNSLISSGCTVYGTVENSVLFRGCVVEEGAVVKNSIVMQSCVIEKGADLNYAIIDRNNLLVSGVTIHGLPKDPFIMEKAVRPVNKH